METEPNFNELFEYRNGTLIRKEAVSNVRAGSVATSNVGNGYLRVVVKRKSYYAHRVIFQMHHGWCPEFIDHVNGDKKDNRIENLRPATKSQNQQNHGRTVKNTSGVKGVTWCKARNKWQAQCDKKTLGRYETIEEAKIVLRKYREQHQGEFANHGTDT